jgi:hypothetical protein
LLNPAVRCCLGKLRQEQIGKTPRIASSGGFNNLLNNGYFWSSSPSGGNAWNRKLNNNYADVNRNNNNQRNGFAVRCGGDKNL